MGSFPLVFNLLFNFFPDLFAMDTKRDQSNELFIRRLHTKILYLEACTFSLENAILLHELGQMTFEELEAHVDAQIKKIIKEVNVE